MTQMLMEWQIEKKFYENGKIIGKNEGIKWVWWGIKWFLMKN